MKYVRVADDVVPLSDFKARAPEWLKRVGESGQPVVITQNGKAAGVLMSPTEYDRLTERVRFVEAVREGLADSVAGRLTPHVEAVSRLRKRLGRE